MKLITHHLVVPTEHTPVTLFPFACVHKDNPGHSANTWRDFLADVKATPNALAIGLGDYHDFLRTHAREFLRHYPHDRDSFNALHDWRLKETEKFAAELEPIKDKLIGLSLGNLANQSAEVAGDIGQFTYDPRTPYMQAQVAQGMPTLWPQAQWMAGYDNTLAQQGYQNQLSAANLDLENRRLAQQGSQFNTETDATATATRDKYLLGLMAAGGTLGAQALAYWLSIKGGQAPPTMAPNYGVPYGSMPSQAPSDLPPPLPDPTLGYQ